MDRRPVLIAGGGIGGLSVALTLHQIGVPCLVLESVRELKPLGVGINLQPSAVRELIELGLGEELAFTGVATRALAYFNKHGQLILNERRGLAAGYRWPQYSIHRGALQAVLLHATRERIGSDNVRCGLRLTGFKQDSGKVTVRLRDVGTGDEVVDTAEILVAADGIHSAVRRQLGN